MRRLPVIFLLLVLIVSCNKTPDYVISEDKMARLMADLYIGDAVVESEHRTYANDSEPEILRTPEDGGSTGAGSAGCGYAASRFRLQEIPE